MQQPRTEIPLFRLQAYAHVNRSVHLFGNVAEKECGKSLEIVESRPRPVLTHKAT